MSDLSTDISGLSDTVKEHFYPYSYHVETNYNYLLLFVVITALFPHLVTEHNMFNKIMIENHLNNAGGLNKKSGLQDFHPAGLTVCE